MPTPFETRRCLADMHAATVTDRGAAGVSLGCRSIGVTYGTMSGFGKPPSRSGAMRDA
jgi:hypothetical protein